MFEFFSVISSITHTHASYELGNSSFLHSWLAAGCGAANDGTADSCGRGGGGCAADGGGAEAFYFDFGADDDSGGDGVQFYCAGVADFSGGGAGDADGG